MKDNIIDPDMKNKHTQQTTTSSHVYYHKICTLLNIKPNYLEKHIGNNKII